MGYWKCNEKELRGNKKGAMGEWGKGCWLVKRRTWALGNDGVRKGFPLQKDTLRVSQCRYFNAFGKVYWFSVEKKVRKKKALDEG